MFMSFRIKSMNNLLATVATGIAICGSIATPVIWGGHVDSVNAVQDQRISSISNTLQQFISTNNSNLDLMNNKINALLWKSGINPNTLQ